MTTEPGGTVVAAVLGVAALVLTSEAVGYLISNVLFLALHLCYRQKQPKTDRRCSLYSALLADRRSNLVETVNNHLQSINADTTFDVKLNWLIRQDTGFKECMELVSRRRSTVIANWASILAICLGSAVTGLPILLSGKAGLWHLAVLGLTILTLTTLFMNAKFARKDAAEMLKLWTKQAQDPTLDAGIRIGSGRVAAAANDPHA